MTTDTDRNFRSYADVDGLYLGAGVVIDPEAERESYDDILKLSHARRVRGFDLSVYGGSENPLDMNRNCEDVELCGLYLSGGGHCAVVIKGGSRDIRLRNVEIADVRSRWCDIELGGWSDQSLERTTGVVLDNVRRTDGKPVRVIVGHADDPTVLGGNVRVYRVRSALLKAFWLWRRLTR